MATSIPVTNSLNRTTTLPDGADCVLGDQGIGCQERQFMLDSLANQYTVKGVAVKQWQLRQIQNCLLFEGKRCDGVPFALGRNESLGRIREREFAQAMFDRDLPNRHGAQVHIIVRVHKDIPGRRGQRRVISDDPQKRACVEQDSHRTSPWIACMRSSGSGSKNSGGTANWPLASPTGRLSARRDCNGRISAIG